MFDLGWTWTFDIGNGMERGSYLLCPDMSRCCGEAKDDVIFMYKPVNHNHNL